MKSVTILRSPMRDGQFRQKMQARRDEPAHGGRVDLRFPSPLGDRQTVFFEEAEPLLLAEIAVRKRDAEALVADVVHPLEEPPVLLAFAEMVLDDDAAAGHADAFGE